MKTKEFFSKLQELATEEKVEVECSCGCGAKLVVTRVFDDMYEIDVIDPILGVRDAVHQFKRMLKEREYISGVVIDDNIK